MLAANWPAACPFCKCNEFSAETPEPRKLFSPDGTPPPPYHHRQNFLHFRCRDDLCRKPWTVQLIASEVHVFAPVGTELMAMACTKAVAATVCPEGNAAHSLQDLLNGSAAKL